MKYAWRSISRNLRVTVSAVAAVLALTFFLSAFTSGIQKNQAQLEYLYETMTVTATVTGYMDAPTAMLSAEQYQTILNSGFIKTSSAMIQKTVNDTRTLRALNDIRLEPDLEGWSPYILWLEGYDGTALNGDEKICLIPKACGIPLGDTIQVKLTGGKKLPHLELRVVGLYGESYGSTRDAVYYCPLKTMEAYLAETGQKLVYNKLEMALRDLGRLNYFKKKMKEEGMDKGVSQLVIHDTLFQKVTRQFRQQIRLLNTLLPVLLAITAGIGFGLCFLLLQGRKKEAAVMRSLGMRRPQVAAVFLTESGLQALTGVLLGGLLARAVLGETAFQLSYLALVLICFLLGGAAAVWKISGVNVFSIMTARE